MPFIYSSTHNLRKCLLAHHDDARLRVIAGADYGRAVDEHAQGLLHALRCDEVLPARDGNLYEVCLLQAYDDGPDRGYGMLLGSWWLGRFCTQKEWRVLVDNLGWGRLLGMLLSGSRVLGPEAAHACIPFVAWLREQYGPMDPDAAASGMCAEPKFGKAEHALKRICRIATLNADALAALDAAIRDIEDSR